MFQQHDMHVLSAIVGVALGEVNIYAFVVDLAVCVHALALLISTILAINVTVIEDAGLALCIWFVYIALLVEIFVTPTLLAFVSTVSTRGCVGCICWSPFSPSQ
jgi:hypothetical protein